MAASVTETLPVLSPGTIATLVKDLSLPPPIAIEPLHVTAAFHSIYLVRFAGDAAPSIPTSTRGKADSGKDDDGGGGGGGEVTLVLRVSGRDIPRAKTANEVAVLRWLAVRTAIPVPAVVRYDASTDNALGREFTLLERVPGASVDKMYESLTEEAKRRLVAQLTDVLVELNSHEWQHVGGLQIDERTGEVVPGPVLEDTFWMVPDVEKYWAGTEESVTTLNPTGPYQGHAELVRAFLQVYIHAISKHESLAWLREDLRPRLEALLAADKLPETQLAATRLVLAHKDLHLANVMAAEDGTLTGILDWEFAGVVPALRWDPVRAFLWNGRQDEAAGAEKERLRAVFEEMLAERGIERWWEHGVSAEVTDVWTVLRFTRALVEVCPREQRAELVHGWRDAAMEALTKLGV